MTKLRYSIKDLENFTQIKAHTIRIWEQRYGLLSPKRSNTNIRYYNEDDLKKILNINFLYTKGYKISKIASLSEVEIINASKALIHVDKGEKQSEIDSLTMNILEFNGAKINSFLDAELSKSSIEELYQSVILPLFEKLGKLWLVNSIDIIHEHYFSNIFKEFLISKISTLNVKSDSPKRAILFLHANEEHEFSILLYYYILKSSGYSCYYFGQNVPIKEIGVAFSQIKPQIVATTFTAKLNEKNFAKIKKSLLHFSEKSQVIVSGSQLNNSDYTFSKDIMQINSITQLKSLLGSN